jgi:DnaK suppressor protein
MNKAIAARRHQSRIKVDAALGRIEYGEYGYCIKCGELIAEERLELAPSNPLCAHCMK